MSIASDILDDADQTIVGGHGDPVSIYDGIGAGNLLNPGGATILGYAQELAIDPFVSKRKVVQLHVANDEYDHIIHIRRDALTGVDLSKVFRLVLNGRNYRMDHYSDSKTGPDLQFFVRLA